MARSDGTLSNAEIVEYLSGRAYVGCTDDGNEDPHQFYHPGQYPGNFKQAISQHITRVQAKKGHAT